MLIFVVEPVTSCQEKIYTSFRRYEIPQCEEINEVMTVEREMG